MKNEVIAARLVQAIREGWTGTNRQMMAKYRMRGDLDRLREVKVIVRDTFKEEGLYWAYDRRIKPHGAFVLADGPVEHQELVRQNEDRAVQRMGDQAAGFYSAKIAKYLAENDTAEAIAVINEAIKAIQGLTDRFPWLGE